MSAAPLPRIVFVLGKGGVGQSTVAAAFGSWRASRGERVLVLEWTIAEAIAPWFGMPAAGVAPCEVAPRLSVANYDLSEALRAYFVDHLKLPRFYRHVVNGAHVRRLIEVAPGIAELLFIGQLWWLTTLAEREAGLAFDRIVVDAPATGHGASLLDLPATLATIGSTGLLALEVERVRAMMANPAHTGAIVVALPEELAVRETMELVPRVTRDLGRPPLAAFVNRSVAGIVRAGVRPAWLDELAARVSPAAREGLETLHDELRRRARFEDELGGALAGDTVMGVFSLAERLAVTGDTSPREIVLALAPALGACFEGAS